MNWSRGLFRLWLLIAIPWMVGSIFVGLNNYRSPYLDEKVYFVRSQDINLDTDKPWKSARVLDSKNLASPDYKGVYSITDYSVQYDVEKFAQKIKFPERVILMLQLPVGEKLSDAFAAKFASTYGDRSADVSNARQGMIADSASFAILPPLIAFILGYALLWALRGFRKP